jgi:hypothetical protein
VVEFVLVAGVVVVVPVDVACIGIGKVMLAVIGDANSKEGGVVAEIEAGEGVGVHEFGSLEKWVQSL